MDLDHDQMQSDLNAFLCVLPQWFRVLVTLLCLAFQVPIGLFNTACNRTLIFSKGELIKEDIPPKPKTVCIFQVN